MATPPLDMEKLLHALENDNNASIADLNYPQIAQEKNDILQRLQLPKDDLKALHQKLKGYRYIDSLEALKYGAYVRWINLTDPDQLYLRNGGVVCDLKVLPPQSQHVHVFVKNNQRRLFQFKFSEVLVFQKLSAQEQIILAAVQLLHTTTDD